MACPLDRGEPCPGCEVCDPAIYLPDPGLYLGPGQEDPQSNARPHPQ